MQPIDSNAGLEEIESEVLKDMNDQVVNSAETAVVDLTDTSNTDRNATLQVIMRLFYP